CRRGDIGVGRDMGVISRLHTHYDGRRPGWQLLDVAGRLRERALYQRAVARDDRAAEARASSAIPATLRERAADGRLRVLVCDGHIPTPDRDSGSARMAWILRLLAPLCAHVTFVPLRQFAYPGYAPPLRDAGVEVVVGGAGGVERLLRR